jgi:uncharacterized protein (TIGR00730 family)
MRSVCVFCGSSAGSDPAYADAARALGTEIARRGLRLVYGGGSIGLMGVVADGALGAGGEVFGVLPAALFQREVAHAGLTRLYDVATMHERKALMAELSDAFIAMPGGYGTLDELFEMTTWTQLGIQCKPVGLLDVAGYFEGLRTFLGRACADGFLTPAHAGLLSYDTSVPRLLDALAARTAER